MRSRFPLHSKFKEGLEFWTTGIWRMETGNLPFFKRIFIEGLKILNLTLQGLFKESIHLRAASLTFYSLLSIVPLLAMIFGVAKGFGLEKVMERALLTRVHGQEEVFTLMIGFARNLLQSTQGSVIAGVGVIVLFWSVIQIFGSIEKSFNEIWEIDKERPLLRKATDYLSLSLLCAILGTISSAATVMITSGAQSLVSRVKMLETVSPAIFLALNFLPVTALWVLFTLIYAAIPNTQVKPVPAILAGVVAGTAFQLFQQLYIEFQIGVAKYNAIYGSFAALPLFLVWLQVSWLIVLVGARLSFAAQHVDRFQHQWRAGPLSPRFERLLALLVSVLVVKRFCSAEGALAAKEIATRLKIPVPVVEGLLNKLVDCGVLSLVGWGTEEEHRYQPAVDPARLTITFVISRLDELGFEDLPVVGTEGYSELCRLTKQLLEPLASSPANVLLKNIYA